MLHPYKYFYDCVACFQTGKKRGHIFYTVFIIFMSLPDDQWRSKRGLYKTPRLELRGVGEEGSVADVETTAAVADDV